jgi:hypothetical protein
VLGVYCARCTPKEAPPDKVPQRASPQLTAAQAALKEAEKALSSASFGRFGGSLSSALVQHLRQG